MFCIAAILCLTGAAAQTPTADEFLKQFSAQRDSITTLRASFVQTTTNPDETVVSEGTLVYTRPKRLIFRYADPALVYMIDGLRVYEYDPDIKQIQIFELEDRPESEAFYLGFESNVKRLQEAYEIRVIPPADPVRHALTVEFLPRTEDEDDEQFFKSVRLNLNKKDLLPSEIVIVNDEESQTSFVVGDFAANETLPADVSQIIVPEGTTIVENDTFAGEAPQGGTKFPFESAPKVKSEDAP